MKDDYLYNWWLWLFGVGLLLLAVIGIFHVILRFPGVLDWKFLMQNFEEIGDQACVFNIHFTVILDDNAKLHRLKEKQKKNKEKLKTNN